MRALTLLVLCWLAGTRAWAPLRIAGRQWGMPLLSQGSSEVSNNTPVPSLSREEQDELDLEDAMAREQYDALRCGEDMLSTEAFLQWEDIEDVLENGIIDGETLEIILEECNVGAQMSFECFKEVVELVNNVTLQMEDAPLDGTEDLSWLPVGGGLEAGGEGEMEKVDEAAVTAMLAAMGIKRKEP